MRISDWSSDVCSSDLSRVSQSTRRYSSSMPTVKLGSCGLFALLIRRPALSRSVVLDAVERRIAQHRLQYRAKALGPKGRPMRRVDEILAHLDQHVGEAAAVAVGVLGIAVAVGAGIGRVRSEEHTYELQSLM